MFYRKPSLLQKAKLQQKAEIDKINNQKVARKVDVYTNAVIDDYVINAGTHKGYTPKMVTSTLKAINKPKVDAEYQKAITSSKTSDSLYHQVKIQKMANEKTIQITEAQYDRLQKNIKAVDKVLRNYELDINKYKKISKERPKTESRRGIITESVMNTNYISSLGYNIKPHVFGYKDLTPVTEGMHRNVQNEAQRELAQSENDEALSKGEEAPNQWKTWIWTGRGETTRHESNDGQTVPFDEPFIIVNDDNGEVDEMMYPLDPAVTSSNGWLCYCEVEYHNNPPESSNFFDFGKGDLDALSLVNELSKMQLPHHEGERKFDVTHDNWEDLRLQVELSEDIPAQHKKLATRLIWEYAHAYHSKAEAVAEHSMEHGYLGANPHKTEFEIVSTYEGIFEFLKQHKLEITEEALVELSENPSVSATVNLVKRQIENYELYTDGAVPEAVENIAEAISEAKNVIKEEQTKEIIEEAAAKSEESNAKYQDYINELLEKENKPLDKKIKDLFDESVKLDEMTDKGEGDYVELYQNISYLAEKVIDLINHVENEVNTDVSKFVKDYEGKSILWHLESPTQMLKFACYHLKNPTKYDLPTNYETLADNLINKLKQNKEKIDSLDKIVAEEQNKVAQQELYKDMLDETNKKLVDAFELSWTAPENEELIYMKVMEAVKDSIDWYNSSLGNFEMANYFKYNVESNLDLIMTQKEGKWHNTEIENNLKNTLSYFKDFKAGEKKIDSDMNDFVEEKLKEIKIKKLEDVVTQYEEDILLDGFNLEEASDLQYLTNEKVKELDQVIDSVHGEFEEILTDYFDKHSINTDKYHIDYEDIFSDVDLMNYIPEAKKAEAAEILYEYAKVTELPYLPQQAAYEVLKKNFEHSEGGVLENLQSGIKDLKTLDDFNNMTETQKEEFQSKYEAAVQDAHNKGTWSWEYEGGSMYGLNNKVNNNYDIPEGHKDIVVKLVYEYYQITHEPVEIVPFYNMIKEHTKYINPLGNDYKKVKTFNDMAKLTEAEKTEIQQVVDNEAFKYLTGNKDLHTFEYADGKDALKNEIMSIPAIPFSEKKFAIDLIWEYMTHNNMKEIDVAPFYEVFNEATKMQENYNPNKPLYQEETPVAVNTGEKWSIEDYVKDAITDIKATDSMDMIKAQLKDYYEGDVEGITLSELTHEKITEIVENAEWIPEEHQDFMVEFSKKFLEEMDYGEVLYPEDLYRVLDAETEIIDSYDAFVESNGTAAPKELTVEEILELLGEKPVDEYAKEVYEDVLDEDWEEIHNPMEEKFEEAKQSIEDGYINYKEDYIYEYDGYDKEGLKDFIDTNDNIPEHHKDLLYELSLIWADNVGEVYPEIFYEILKENSVVFENFDNLINEGKEKFAPEPEPEFKGFENLTPQESYEIVKELIDDLTPEEIQKINEEIENPALDEGGLAEYYDLMEGNEGLKEVIEESDIIPPELKDFTEVLVTNYNAHVNDVEFPEKLYEALKKHTDLFEKAYDKLLEKNPAYAVEESVIPDTLNVTFDPENPINTLSDFKDMPQELIEVIQKNQQEAADDLGYNTKIFNQYSEDYVKEYLKEFDNIPEEHREFLYDVMEAYYDATHEDIHIEVFYDAIRAATNIFEVHEEALLSDKIVEFKKLAEQEEILAEQLEEAMNYNYETAIEVIEELNKIIFENEELKIDDLNFFELSEYSEILRKFTEQIEDEVLEYWDYTFEENPEQHTLVLETLDNIKTLVNDIETSKQDQLETLKEELTPKPKSDNLDTIVKIEEVVDIFNEGVKAKAENKDCIKNVTCIGNKFKEVKKEFDKVEIEKLSPPELDKLLNELEKTTDAYITMIDHFNGMNVDLTAAQSDMFKNAYLDLKAKKEAYENLKEFIKENGGTIPEPAAPESSNAEEVSKVFENHEDVIKELTEKFEEFEELVNEAPSFQIPHYLKQMAFSISIQTKLHQNFNNEGIAKLNELAKKTKEWENKVEEIDKSKWDYKDAIEKLEELDHHFDVISENPITNLDYYIENIDKAILENSQSEVSGEIGMLSIYYKQVLEPLKEADVLTETQKKEINEKLSKIQEDVEYVTSHDNVDWGKEEAAKIEEYKFKIDTANEVKPSPEDYVGFEDKTSEIKPIEEKLEILEERVKNLDDWLENAPELITYDDVANLVSEYHHLMMDIQTLKNDAHKMDIESSKKYGELMAAIKEGMQHINTKYDAALYDSANDKYYSDKINLEHYIEDISQWEYYHAELSEGISEVFVKFLAQNEYIFIVEGDGSFTGFMGVEANIRKFIEDFVKPNEEFITNEEKLKMADAIDEFIDTVKESDASVDEGSLELLAENKKLLNIEGMPQHSLSELYTDHELMVEDIKKSWKKIKDFMKDTKEPTEIEANKVLDDFDNFLTSFKSLTNNEVDYSKKTISELSHIIKNFKSIKEKVYDKDWIDVATDSGINALTYEHIMKDIEYLEHKFDTLSENPVKNLDYYIEDVYNALSTNNADLIAHKFEPVIEYGETVLKTAKSIKEFDAITNEQKIEINEKISKLQHTIETEYLQGGSFKVKDILPPNTISKLESFKFEIDPNVTAPADAVTEENYLTGQNLQDLKDAVQMIEDLIKVQDDYPVTKHYIEQFNEFVEEANTHELSQNDKLKIINAVMTVDVSITNSSYSEGMKDILKSKLKKSEDYVTSYVEGNEGGEGEINLLDAPVTVIHDIKKMLDDIYDMIEEDKAEAAETHFEEITEKMEEIKYALEEAVDVKYNYEAKKYWEELYKDFDDVNDEYLSNYEESESYWFDNSPDIESFEFDITELPTERSPAVQKFVNKHSKFIEEELGYIDNPLELTKKIKKMGKDYRQLFENGKVSYEDQVTIIKMGEKIRKTVFENLNEGVIFDHDGNQHDRIRVMLQKEIPEKRVIEAYQNRKAEGYNGEEESLHKESLHHIVQGKGTINYYQQFEPVKPPKEIMRKFYEFEAWTPEELQSLTPNHIHYIINELERPPVCEGHYRPVGESADCQDYLGRDLMTEHNPDWNDASMTWTSAEYKAMNDFYNDPFKFIGETRSYTKYEHESMDSDYENYGHDIENDGVSFRATYKLKDLVESVIPNGFIFFRGSDNFHVNDRPDDPKGNHAKAGDVFCWDRFNSISLRQDCGGFAHYDRDTGHMTNRLTTILSPPGANGGYLDYRSHFEREAEVLHGPRMEYQVIVLDEATNTMLVRVVKSEYKDKQTPKENAFDEAYEQMQEFFRKDLLDEYLDELGYF